MGFKEIRSSKWFSWGTNIYLLVLSIFVIWMLFFDTNSFLIHSELRKEVKTLEKQKEFLEKEIAKDKKILERLSDPEELEKFAREQYNFKKKNEEIYLIEYEDSVKVKNNNE